MSPLEKKIIKDFDASDFIVCTDAGLSSTTNRKFNSIQGRGFVTTQSVKKLKVFSKISVLMRMAGIFLAVIRNIN